VKLAAAGISAFTGIGLGVMNCDAGSTVWSVLQSTIRE
jgi:hypothetical protein